MHKHTVVCKQALIAQLLMYFVHSSLIFINLRLQLQALGCWEMKTKTLSRVSKSTFWTNLFLSTTKLITVFHKITQNHLSDFVKNISHTHIYTPTNMVGSPVFQQGLRIELLPNEVTQTSGQDGPRCIPPSRATREDPAGLGMPQYHHRTTGRSGHGHHWPPTQTHSTDRKIQHTPRGARSSLQQSGFLDWQKEGWASLLKVQPRQPDP